MRISKKIIAGKLYDIATAQLVGKYDNGISGFDFDYHAEALYLKKTGEFFVHGSGGARSEYACVFGDGSSCYGETIIPITREKAKEWCAEHVSVEKYVELFGEVEE